MIWFGLPHLFLTLNKLLSLYLCLYYRWVTNNFELCCFLCLFRMIIVLTKVHTSVLKICPRREAAAVAGIYLHLLLPLFLPLLPTLSSILMQTLGRINNNNNNNDFISIALFHVRHAQLRWTIQMFKHTHHAQKPEAKHYTLRHLSKTHTSQHYNRVKKLHTSLH